MSRALLLIIADFLLLSLLALARFDQPDEGPPREEQVRLQEESAAQQDLFEMLKISLENEEQNRRSLVDQLKNTRSDLESRVETLEVTESELRKSREDLEDRSATASLLAEEKEKLESIKRELEEEKSVLTENYADTQAMLVASQEERSGLAERLSEARESAAANKERVRFLQEQLEDKETEIERADKDIRALEEQRRTVERENRQLDTQLQIRETEKRMLKQNLIAAQAEIETVRVEKEAIQKQTSKLAEGVSVLAKSSTAIHEEIRQIQPLSLNTIFREFKDNRATVSFTTELSNGRERNFDADSILVSDGEDTFALFHARDTPFRLDGSRSQYSSISASANLGESNHKVVEVAFLAVDPRVMVARMKRGSDEISGTKVFPLAQDPFRFPGAVLISGNEDYYGESTFKLESGRSEYLRMQSRLFNRLFGEFSPKRGDLVFAKTGDFLGLMVNNQYCVLVNSLFLASKFSVGDAYSPEQTESAHRIGRGLLAERARGFQ